MRWTCDTSYITWTSKSSNDAWKCLKSPLDLSGNAFQTDELATENARQPNLTAPWNDQFLLSSRSQVLTSSELRRWREEACQVLWSGPMEQTVCQYCQLVAHPVDEVERMQLFMQQKRQAAVVLLCVADEAGSSIYNSLQLVCGGSRWLCKDHVAVVDTRCHKCVEMSLLIPRPATSGSDVSVSNDRNKLTAINNFTMEFIGNTSSMTWC